MFADFITRSGKTRAAWAKRIGVSRSYLSDMLNGNKVPSLSLAARIQRLTDGAVPATSWVADEVQSDPPGDSDAPEHALAPDRSDAA